MNSTMLRRVMRPSRPEPSTESRSTRYSAAIRRTAGDKRRWPSRCAAWEGASAAEEPSPEARGEYCSVASFIDGGIAAYHDGGVSGAAARAVGAADAAGGDCGAGAA